MLRQRFVVSLVVLRKTINTSKIPPLQRAVASLEIIHRRNKLYRMKAKDLFSAAAKFY